MFFIIYRKREIDILKCSKCKGYSIELARSDKQGSASDWIDYRYFCDKCKASGAIRISANANMEGFDTWDELQDRIDELKVAMNPGSLADGIIHYPNSE